MREIRPARVPTQPPRTKHIVITALPSELSHVRLPTCRGGDKIRRRGGTHPYTYTSAIPRSCTFGSMLRTHSERSV